MFGSQDPVEKPQEEVLKEVAHEEGEEEELLEDDVVVEPDPGTFCEFC